MEHWAAQPAVYDFSRLRRRRPIKNVSIATNEAMAVNASVYV